MVVIEWVNIACPNAQTNYQSGNIPKLQKQYAEKDVVWLSMIITQKQQNENGSKRITEERAHAMAQKMAEKYGASPTAVLVDVGGTVSDHYATKTSMHMFVVNREGVLVYDGAYDNQWRAVKSLEANLNFVGAALDEAMAGEPVTTAKTKPYGCHPILGS